MKSLVMLALVGCAAPAHPTPHTRTVLVGATVITAPDAVPIADAAVVIEDGRIAAVGPRATVRVPDNADLVDVHGATITAGFWNSHVHFTEAKWSSAVAGPLAEGLRDMLTRWGFTHVVDTGSTLAQTVALRRRIESGEIAGPVIRTAGPVFVAVGGQPIYIPFKLPELATPEAARARVTETLDAGADIIKLMTASVVAHPPPPVMPHDVIRAVTATAHARGALVFAHPTNLDGVNAARDGGVDVLAHTAPGNGPWSDDEARSLVAAGISLVPTLSLWRPELTGHAPPQVVEQFEAEAMQQAHAFAAAGGVLLFGTDVGYRPEYDPTPEHRLLARAGLSFSARLAMLTTAPARRFGDVHNGTVAPGMDADLVVLDGDPTQDPAAFARVRCTLHRGAVIYASAPGACKRDGAFTFEH